MPKKKKKDDDWEDEAEAMALEADLEVQPAAGKKGAAPAEEDEESGWPA